LTLPHPPVQIYLQLYGIAIATGWSGIVTAIIFVVVDKLCGGIRVDPIYEEVGLDIAQLGVTLVAMPKKALEKEIQRINAHDKQKGSADDASLDAVNHGGEDEPAEEVNDHGPSILM
jgi:hypothetical protein